MHKSSIFSQNLPKTLTYHNNVEIRRDRMRGTVHLWNKEHYLSGMGKMVFPDETPTGQRKNNAEQDQTGRAPRLRFEDQKWSIFKTNHSLSAQSESVNSHRIC